MGMVTMRHGKECLRLSLLLLFAASFSPTQTTAAAPPDQEQGAPPSAGQRIGANEGRGQPLLGKITAISKKSLEIVKPDGTTATVKTTEKTEYRRDRQGAKLEDFKVGDMVFVRGEENADHSVTALLIGGRSGGGGPEGGARVFGEMGKDFVVGEVKSVDAPKLTVLRPDNVTQTLELNEETSIRRGRESITMADIQVGHHVVVRGGVQNNTFVPKNVMVLSAEQWKRMQEMGLMIRNGSDGTGPAVPPKDKPPQS
jgi:hypothetical protein